MTNAKAIYLQALTPVHSGTGQAVAVIDLPIAREKATGFPIIPASSLKGVLKDQYNREDRDDAFGTQDAGGAFTFTDQRILCLPVRSYYGTFAYVTCPLVLTRFYRDMSAFGLTVLFDGSQIPDVTDGTDSLKIALTDQSVLQQNNTDGTDSLKIALTDQSVLQHDNQIYLEDLDLSREPNATENTTAIAKAVAETIFVNTSDQTNFRKRFAIVSDATFSFLCETATEIAARIALEEDTKTVKHGGLWYEEAVPAETIFHGVLMMADHYKRNGVTLDHLTIDKAIQIGGNATVGRGLCRVVIK